MVAEQAAAMTAMREELEEVKAKMREEEKSRETAKNKEDMEKVFM